MSANTKTARGFLIPIRVVNKAAREGIKLPELQDMLRRSARCTHPDGNRRYHDYVFMVEGKRVLSIHHCAGIPAPVPHEPEVDDEPFDPTVYKCDTCRDKRKIQVFNECPRCEGEGCKRCDEGLVPSAISCPECTTQRTLFKRKK